MASIGKRGQGPGYSFNPPTRPAYSKGNKVLVLDASKFDAEPLPRETRGFQPRQIQPSADVPNGNTTSATPFGTRSHDAQAATPTAIKTEPPPRETQGTWPRQDQSISDAQHGNMTSASPSGIRSHDTQVDEPTNEDKGASRTLLTNTVIHPDRAPGLSDSQWAPKATLTSLAGLRPHPEPVKAWDDSNGFKLSTRLGIDFNELPRHAWNGGVDPMSTRKATSSVGRATPQPVNPVVRRANEVTMASVEPAEPGLRTKFSKPDNNIDMGSNDEPAIAKNLLPPHLRPPKPRKTALTSATSAVDCVKDQSSTVESSSLKPMAPSSPKGKGKASPENGATAETNSNLKTVHNEAQIVRQRSKKNYSKPQDDGWDQPVAPAHPLLNAWDGSPADPPVDWEYRSQQPIPKKERKASFQSWLDGQASESVANNGTVDITSPEFILGTGVVHENSIVSGYVVSESSPPFSPHLNVTRKQNAEYDFIDRPSDQEHATLRLPNDPLTLARVDQTAQAKLEEHRAKFKEEDVKEKLTKQERHALREEMMQREIELAKAPNPYKPVADIYIRPAERKDIPQITEIYNHYGKISAIVLELDPLTNAEWVKRMDGCREEGFDMFVAVQKTATGNGQTRRAHAREEPVFGFTYAEHAYNARHVCRFTASVQVYVIWRHLRIGVGRCLMDRVMTMLNFNHDCKPGVEYVGAKPLLQREVKKVIIEVPYWEDHPEETQLWYKERNAQTGEMETHLGWKTRLLQSLKFEHVATLPGIGLKQAGLAKSKSVGIAMFVLDTMATLDGYRDYH